MKIFSGNISLRRYIFSFIAAFCITLVICAVTSIIFAFFSPPDRLYSIFIKYFCYFSASAAAFLSAMGTQKNGMITGILCADIYMLVLILAGAIIFKTGFPLSSALKIFGFTSVFGGIAGILGINFKK